MALYADTIEVTIGAYFVEDCHKDINYTKVLGKFDYLTFLRTNEDEIRECMEDAARRLITSKINRIVMKDVLETIKEIQERSYGPK